MKGSHQPMKRWVPLLLALVLLPFSAFAVDIEIPQIDPAAAGIAARSITSEDDAIAYAQTLWASNYLYENTDGMIWRADLNDGVYTVTAGTHFDGIDELTVQFGSDGIVTYLYNGISRSDFCRSGTYDGTDEAALAAYLLNFTDALNPGAGAALENLKAVPEAIVYSDRMILHFNTPITGGDGVIAMFNVEISPRVRVVDYNVFVPLAPADNSRG
jgi:hypothetical protein